MINEQTRNNLELIPGKLYKLSGDLMGSIIPSIVENHEKYDKNFLDDEDYIAFVKLRNLEKEKDDAIIHAYYLFNKERSILEKVIDNEIIALYVGRMTSLEAKGHVSNMRHTFFYNKTYIYLNLEFLNVVQID